LTKVNTKKIQQHSFILLLIEQFQIFRPESPFFPINNMQEGLDIFKRKNGLTGKNHRSLRDKRQADLDFPARS